MSNTVTIRLPKELQKELDKIVKTEKTSKSEVVRAALDSYLSVRRFRSLRKKILPFAEAQGLLTDEDIFKAVS